MPIDTLKCRCAFFFLISINHSELFDKKAQRKFFGHLNKNEKFKFINYEELFGVINSITFEKLI